MIQNIYISPGSVLRFISLDINFDDAEAPIQHYTHSPPQLSVTIMVGFINRHVRTHHLNSAVASLYM